ncbi:MAG: alpha-L-fucosidase [Pseudozobellia sp.]|nr:alpha-L-fucosidase [Pseudozobellia sp.]|tara:strand:- start:92835 stop:94928 length:2094 start_codon:yes stop_codon:yes gene_type:complete
MTKTKLFLIAIICLLASCKEVVPPKPVGPLPSERQLAWHGLEYYAFIHFNMNTFTDMEWGLGGESPDTFNPSELDTRQWAKVAKDAGMKGIIITAKHHDGFCLWPTKTTEHSVKNSPWKDGKGDLIKDLSEACKEFGLKFGVYLSPWDRNDADYGKPAYVARYHEQLRELLTNYGEVFEVWFDGANGGTGYYGGANEERKIDNKTYYEWDRVTEIVRELQPNAVIFSDGGPDIRWVGTEEGFANETNWSIMRRDEIYPGWPRYKELRSGHEDGTHWLPAEVNTSIRPGWYYHPREDHQVKSLARLVQTYYESIGRNGNFLLNLPVDTRGLVHETDVKQLLALKNQIDKDFAHELAEGIKVQASNVRGENGQYAADQVNDGDAETYWATDDEVTTASLIFEFDKPTEVNRILLQEYIPLGQRVIRFSVEAEADGSWKKIDEQTTIGNKRILRFETVKASKVRVNFLESKGPLVISNIELYRAPNFLTTPFVSRARNGEVTLTVADDEVDIYYTLDGSEPTNKSDKYEKPFLVSEATTLKSIGYDAETGEQSETQLTYIDIPKSDWKVVKVSSGKMEDAGKMIDENPDSSWATERGVKSPQEVTIDLGKKHMLTGFTYLPIQDRYPFGIITDYEFSVSVDGKSFRTVSKGEFGNVVNNRILQTVNFEPVSARYIRLKGSMVDSDDHTTSFAEVGVITKQ